MSTFAYHVIMSLVGLGVMFVIGGYIAWFLWRKSDPNNQ